MYMVYYFIRIAREIFGRRKLQKILILALVFIIIFWVYCKLGAFAYTGLDGNDDYTDPNNSIFLAYDGYLNDLAIRLNNSSSSDATDLIDRLCNSKYYSFIVMYGQTTSDQNNDFRHMRVILFNSDSTFGDSTVHNAWLNMNCQIVFNNSNPVFVYDFDNMTCTRSTSTSTFYFPKILLNRYNNTLVEVLANKTNNDSSNLIGAINNQTSAINNQTSVIEDTNDIMQDTQDFITDDDTDESEMTVDTSSTNLDDNTGIDNFFATFLGNIEDLLNDYTENEITYITVPLLPSGNSVRIPSNLLYKAIPPGFLRTLIQLFWTFLFGGYIVNYIYRMLKWLSTGKVFGDGGVADFIWYLDTNNEIIKGYMM